VPPRVRVPTCARARAALVLVAASALLGAADAGAAASAETARETQRLRSANEILAAESQAVVLELYALESELAGVAARVAALRVELSEVERREEGARRDLARVRRALREGERRLASRIRDLYIAGDPDVLSILLGAESLGDAIAKLENLGRFARQDRAVVASVKAARREVGRALQHLASRELELRELASAAAAAQAELVAARSERRAYLDRLLAERRLNEAQLGRLARRADEARAASEEIEREAGSETSGETTTAVAAPAAPPPPAAPVSGGRSITVLATGYSLPGTTATGVPVGWGIVAVDPSVIPLGTRMTIPGYGEGVAADTGGAVQGTVIDVWFPTPAQALAWGRRTVTITLH
jgi:3D (Asp-Asp-Asp) domain-containing protein/septal ring factor EnvC (AmiA/AmiB activator)